VIKRQCIECGGELVMAYRPGGIERSGMGVEGMAMPNAKWRCSTCGHSYTAEQLRAGARLNSKEIVQG
jgi:DNA-directed RNA polymerase subunit RPC12/RpoP